jgi:hypothetical protein
MLVRSFLCASTTKTAKEKSSKKARRLCSLQALFFVDCQQCQSTQHEVSELGARVLTVAALRQALATTLWSLRQGATRHYMPMPPIPPMPPISPPPIGIGASAFGASAIMHSVVSIRDATLAAFCSAVRVTLVGSKIPISIMSP